MCVLYLLATVLKTRQLGDPKEIFLAFQKPQLQFTRYHQYAPFTALTTKIEISPCVAFRTI